MTMRLLSTFVALSLSASAAMAGSVAPLSPGHPAGVKTAQMGDNTILYTVLGAGAVAFAAYAVSQGGHTNLSPVVAPGTSFVTGSTAS